MNDRTRERILMAAANCEPKDYRQAALIGGIAQTLIETGHFLPHQALAHAADRMGWGLAVATDMGFDPFPTKGFPTVKECGEAARLFKAQYDPPGEMVAA